MNTYKGQRKDEASHYETEQRVRKRTLWENIDEVIKSENYKRKKPTGRKLKRK